MRLDASIVIGADTDTEDELTISIESKGIRYGIYKLTIPTGSWYCVEWVHHIYKEPVPYIGTKPPKYIEDLAYMYLSP